MGTISIIAAVAENRAIGKDRHLLCHLPDDLKLFKKLTLGRTIVMGRKTFESLPNGALPGRKNIVITSGKGFYSPDVLVAHSIEEAIALCRDETDIFFIGGAAVYKEALKIADTLYITKIHHSFPDADTFFPDFDESAWIEIKREDYPCDERHAYPYTFFIFRRRGK